MAEAFPRGIDLLNIGQLVGVRAEVLAADPATPGLGRFYWNSVSLRPLFWDGTAFTNKATDSDLLGGENKAAIRARSSHTGTQTASTISDFNTAVRTNRLNEMTAPNAAVAWNSQRITGLANGTGPQDAATVAQVEAARAGVRKTFAVEARAVGNVNLAAPGASVDGHAMNAGEPFAALDQTTDADKGLYVWNGAAVAATRLPDADSFAELDAGTELFVESGATHGGKVFRQTAELTAFTGQVWGVVAAGTTYTAGDGLTESPAGTFNVVANADATIIVAANDIKVNPAKVGRVYTSLLGDNSASSFTKAHGLGTGILLAQVFKVSDGEEWGGVCRGRDATNIICDFGAYVPAVDAFRLVVVACA